MQRSFESIRESDKEALLCLLKAETMLRNYTKKYNAKHDNRTMGENRVQTVISGIRSEINHLMPVDPLWWRSQFRSSENRSRRFLFNNNYNNTVYFDSEQFWVDDFIKCVKSGNSLDLHRKDCFFRIGDEFYNKEDYLMFNDKAYSKKEYAVNGKHELVSLKNSIPVSGHYYTYSYRIDLDVSDWLTPGDCEMECIDSYNHDHLIRVSVYSSRNGEGRYSGHFFNMNYWLSMFKFGDNRYFYRNAGSNAFINLTEDMLRKIELAPTTDHLRIWNDAREKIKEAVKDNPDAEDSAPHLAENGAEVAFALNYNTDVVRTASIKDKIIRNIADGNILQLGEFLDKIKLLKDILNEEAKYVKAK